MIHSLVDSEIVVVNHEGSGRLMTDAKACNAMPNVVTGSLIDYDGGTTPI